MNSERENVKRKLNVESAHLFVKVVFCERITNKNTNKWIVKTTIDNKESKHFYFMNSCLRNKWNKWLSNSRDV